MNDPTPTEPVPSAVTPWVMLAHLLRPQGRKGELLADLLTDFPNRFHDRQGVSLRRPDGSIQPTTVEDHWLPVGRNAGRIVLKLQGTDSIEAAGRLAGFDLVVLPDDRLALDDDAEYIADLLGCTVLDAGEAIGNVEDVHFPATASGTRQPEAAPLLLVRSADGAELLIPFIKDWIEAIDIPNRRITMHLPAGLLAINAAPSAPEDGSAT